MYSLIGRLFEGKQLYTVKIPLPSLIFEYDLFLAGALLAVGLFILVSHIKSWKYRLIILITLGLSFSLASYLVQ